jgi:hypothetical protein
VKSAQPISSACVARKTRKTGSSASTLSLTPRRLRTMSSVIAATSTGLGHLPYYPKRGANGSYVRTLAQLAADF